ncbi:MAG: hypothetical protein ACOH14_10655 [Rhodoglobus sp.]
MIDQLLRPKVAFWTGLGLLILGHILATFVTGSLYWAAQSIGFPLASQFANGLASGFEFLTRVAVLIGPALIVGALIMLKIERTSATTPSA